jgi:regulator of nucleoside diphosphate kinase
MNEPITLTIADMAALRLLRGHASLRRELDRASVVSSAAIPPDVATMNSRVRYTDETAGEQRTVSLVYPEHVDGAPGRVSVLAPVGTALLGLSAGQAIEWHQPQRLRNTPLPRAP